MGLTEMLAGAACSRAHVLVAEAPGAFRERVALQRALDRAGWVIAESVADADVLAVVGDPGEALADVVEHAWAQMSEPRARLQVREDAAVDVLLHGVRDELRAKGRRHVEPPLRRGFTPAADRAAGDDSAMSPDGIPLAEGAEDRDGLEMDELHVPLGPVLAHWPAGVVLRVTLHGDVVVDAEAEQLDGPGAATVADDAATRAARLLDAAASVLTLAGLPADSARARRLRDRCLDGGPVDGREVAGLGARVGRRRSLRWLLTGLVHRGRHGGEESLHDRLTGLFERARVELAGEVPRRTAPGLPALPGLVRGQELAAVRLWLAATMPDLTGHETGESVRG